MREPGRAPEDEVLEVVTLEGFSSLSHSVMYWLKAKCPLGHPGILWFPPKFRHQTQPEFPAALEETGLSEIRWFLL